MFKSVLSSKANQDFSKRRKVRFALRVSPPMRKTLATACTLLQAAAIAMMALETRNVRQFMLAHSPQS
jgi:hypothetical protein